MSIQPSSAYKEAQAGVLSDFSSSELKTYFKTFDVLTDQNNLFLLEPKLAPHIEEHDYFYIKDFTQESYEWVQESGIQSGFMTIQAMHTTCIIGINELDEPCLLGDINAAVRHSFPKFPEKGPYLHNSKLRTKNLCEDDNKCDRNADAHLKSFLLGSPSQTLIIRDGKPLYGQWQRLCFIDFDGPRRRHIAVQMLGK